MQAVLFMFYTSDISSCNMDFVKINVVIGWGAFNDTLRHSHLVLRRTDC